MPPIRFFLADTDHPIDSRHPLWHQPLPDRNASVSAGLTGKTTAPLAYGDYFNAVSAFCTANRWDTIRRACRQARQRPVAEQDISGVGIFLEKHGALYHPARVLVALPDQKISFVVNVAASAEGRRTLPIETRALARLGDQRPFGWLPTVFAATTTPIPMFLADWFEGYHEFHLTHRAGKHRPSIIVWDGAGSPTLLSENQAGDLYRQAAMILTACYDPVTTDQIFPWHHAAGDFVVRAKDDRVDVKLITARNHAPVFATDAPPADERELLDSLVAFCIHLSIRMRLDRIDGVSDVAWAPDACLVPMIDGFFKGLDLTGRLSGFPEGFDSLFQDYFAHQQPAQLTETAKQLVRAVFGKQGDERRIVDRHVEQHVQQIHRCIGSRQHG